MTTLQKLQEIANCIEIRTSDFSVYHSRYKLHKNTHNSREKLKKLSDGFQEKSMISLLNDMILNIYFHGTVNLENESLIKPQYPDFYETTSEVDWDFYERLHQSNQGTGWWNPNYEITNQETDGSRQVKKKNVTVYIQRDYHLHPSKKLAKVGDLVSVYTPKGRILNKYYLAYGNFVNFGKKNQVLIYFNINPEGMIILIKQLTEKLNNCQVPFSFYTLHNPCNYGQYKSGFMQINQDKYQVVKEIIEDTYPENKKYFNSQTPIFTKAIAPGISLAEKPENEFEFIEYFGANRCTIVAQALLEAHKNGDNSPEVRMEYIFKSFENLGIDLEHPYLNPNSQDNYPPLFIE